jgi:hypothetical protein
LGGQDGTRPQVGQIGAVPLKEPVANDKRNNMTKNQRVIFIFPSSFGPSLRYSLEVSIAGLSKSGKPIG